MLLPGNNCMPFKSTVKRKVLNRHTSARLTSPGGNLFWIISPQIWYQVYSMSSGGYCAGKRKKASSQPLQSEVARAPHQNGKSPPPDRARLTGELCLILGDSLSDLLGVCVYLLAQSCTSVWYDIFPLSMHDNYDGIMFHPNTQWPSQRRQVLKITCEVTTRRIEVSVLLNVMILWPLSLCSHLVIFSLQNVTTSLFLFLWTFLVWMFTGLQLYQL